MVPRFKMARRSSQNMEIEYTSAPECNESVDIVEAEVWEERTAITITGVKHNEECPELILDT